jgi:uncharacterized membrane protein YuzA (DUF378 family)
MKGVHVVSFILVIVGALNWGLVGVFQWNLVTALFGIWPTLVEIIYALVAIAAIVLIATHSKSCKDCCVPKAATPTA